MRLFLAIILGKFIAQASRLLSLGGGSAAPGLYALKVEPQLVNKLAQKIKHNVVITGTNGKTTTARMVSHFARSGDLKVVRNATGSNLERGIASTLIDSFTLKELITGNRGTKFGLGIWELDEAAFNQVLTKINPQAIVFLNVFRDQLDRYGEVDSVVQRWCQTLKEISPNTSVILNADDANIRALVDCFRGKAQIFGLVGRKILGEAPIYTKKKIRLDFSAEEIIEHNLESISFQLETNTGKVDVNLPLPGIYHVYDFLAAFAVARNLSIPTKVIVESLQDYSPAFGRVEKLDFGYIFLIKNPTGATQVFETITPNLRQGDRLLIALNDELADGTDVSWIWDANFEKLKIQGAKKIVCSGTRAYDLATRLKYAGFEERHLLVELTLGRALNLAKENLKGKLFILPTYTAMLELQKILTRLGMKRHYWQES